MATATVVKFTPRWNSSIEGHAVNRVRKFYGQLCSDHEFDDLMQEAFIVFWRCKQRYSGTVDNPKWFMALFSRSLTNHLINLTEKSGRYISIEAIGDDFPEPATDLDEPYLRAVASQMPEAVRKLYADVVSGAVADGRPKYTQLAEEFGL